MCGVWCVARCSCSYLRVVGGAVDAQQVEDVGEDVGGVEADDGVGEVLVAELGEDLVRVVQAVLGGAQRAQVAAQQRADERVGGGLGERARGQQAAQAQHGAQRGAAQHGGAGPQDAVGRPLRAARQVAQLVVHPRPGQDAGAHAHYHRRVASGNVNDTHITSSVLVIIANKIETQTQKSEVFHLQKIFLNLNFSLFL